MREETAVLGENFCRSPSERTGVPYREPGEDDHHLNQDFYIAMVTSECFTHCTNGLPLPLSPPPKKKKNFPLFTHLFRSYTVGREDGRKRTCLSAAKMSFHFDRHSFSSATRTYPGCGGNLPLGRQVDPMRQN